MERPKGSKCHSTGKSDTDAPSLDEPNLTTRCRTIKMKYSPNSFPQLLPCNRCNNRFFDFYLISDESGQSTQQLSQRSTRLRLDLIKVISNSITCIVKFKKTYQDNYMYMRKKFQSNYYLSLSSLLTSWEKSRETPKNRQLRLRR